MGKLNWAGIVAGLIFGQALSYVWYNMLFGAMERALEPGAPSGAMVYAEGAVLSLVLLVGLGWIIRATGAQGWMGGLKTGVMFWIFFMLTTELMRPVYMGTPLRQTEIDLGYELVFLAVASALIGGLSLGRKAPAAA